MSTGFLKGDILSTKSSDYICGVINTPLDDSNFLCEDYLCILLKSGNYISIDSNNTVELNSDMVFGKESKKRFFKLRVSIEPGNKWTKKLDYTVEDYQRILSDSDIIYKLENSIEPNPTYIDEMKSELRELQINKIVK